MQWPARNQQSAKSVAGRAQNARGGHAGSLLPRPFPHTSIAASSILPCAPCALVDLTRVEMGRGYLERPVIRKRTVSTPLKVLPEERMRFRNCWTFPSTSKKKRAKIPFQTQGLRPRV